MTISPLPLALDLIRCPSITPHDAGAQHVLARALTALGFTCTHLPFEGDGEPRVENLYARLGTGAPFLCFAGHTDVVPVGDELKWSVPPFAPEVQGDYLIGRGAEDMKAAIACMVAAVARVQESGVKISGSIGFIITGDEEGYAINGTRKMVQWMKAHGEVPDACVVGEPTNPEAIGDMVKIGRRGSMNMVLTVRGKQGHVAYPHLANNPVTPLVALLSELKTTPIDQGMEFFQPSNLEITSIDVGNPAKNVIPEEATARINIRFNPLHNSAGMKEWLEKIVRKHVQDYHLEVRVTGEAFLTKPCAFTTLVADAVKDATGRMPELSTTGGTSDARFIKDLCPVAEFGTTGKTSHAIDEKVKVADLELLTQCYEGMIRRFFS